MSPSTHAKEEGSQDPAPVSAGGSYTIRVSRSVLSHTTTHYTSDCLVVRTSQSVARFMPGAGIQTLQNLKNDLQRSFLFEIN
jgi:hypothetical protein